MTAFILLALIMALIAVGAVVWPLRRQSAGRRRDDEAGLDVYRERDAELVREHERGNLDDAEFAEAREELERELLAVTDRAGSRATAGDNRSLPTVIGVAATVPAVAIAAYIATGSPGLTGGGESGGLSPAQVERFRDMGPAQRIAELEPVVERQPKATRAWILLAQAYRATGRYGDAVNAYARVQSQGDPDPWFMARQAEALLLANGRRFTNSVERLVQRALELDDRNPLALMLAGHAAMARGDDEQAVRHWRRLAEEMPADSENREMLERLIAEARGADAPDSATSAEMTPSTGNNNGAAGDDGGDAAITVRVSLASALAEDVPGGSPVFVFARAADASGGAPLAVQRTTVDALPVEITLTDAEAMTPEQRLSQAERVRITARVSLQGDVMPQSGDLQGESGTVEVGPDARAAITIDQRIP